MTATEKKFNDFLSARPADKKFYAAKYGVTFPVSNLIGDIFQDAVNGWWIPIDGFEFYVAA